MKRKITIALAVLLALAVIGFGWLWFAPCGMGGCAPVTELEQFQTEGSQLLDVAGRPFATLGMGSRRVVPIDSLPKYLTQAFLSVEDRRFYEHGGVDWKRFGGALFKNVKSGGVEEGGSTITMQLARNLFPRTLPYRERSLRRKVLEIRIARQIERRFDKDKILELYLNHIYLGEGAYGVDAAAQEYFGKPAAKLTLAEAAVLGGLPVSPARINPREDREAATRRRDIVLRQMAKAGFISQAAADAAIREPIRLARHGRSAGEGDGRLVRGARAPRAGRGPGELRRHRRPARVHHLRPRGPARRRGRGGAAGPGHRAGAYGAFRHPVYTRGKTDSEEEGNTTYLQGTALVMEARTGEVRALVGGRDDDDSKFDRVFKAVRQPGSAFKPFVYLTALESGTPPSEIFEDEPVTFHLAGAQLDAENYTGGYSTAP